MRKCVLIVLDGWGIGHSDDSNPIYIRNPKNIKYIKENFPIGSLQASGIAVGLPWGEEGNSEVGHLTIGAGKTIYQHYPRITMALQSGDFEKNKAILNAINSSLEKKTALHILGLLGGGIVHSSIDHLIALMHLAKKKGVQNLNLHLFADGKDSAPRSVEIYLNKIQKIIDETKIGRIASLIGRYYAMDRDERWELIERTYDILIGKAVPAKKTAKEIIKNTYDKGLNDDFIEPSLLIPEGAIKNNDSVIFFDYREDSIKEICQTLADANFNHFPIQKLDLTITTFTNYSSKIKTQVAFPPEEIIDSLGKIISDNNLIQLRLAETEKYPHATYFFNGLKETPFTNEYRVIIPSRKTAHHDEAPEMMSKEITNRLIQAIEGQGFDFIFVNFANSDVIAHSGNYDAALKVVDIVDEQIGKIINLCLEKDITLIITADHGNLEVMIDIATSRVETKHDPSPVPIYLIDKRYKRTNNTQSIKQKETQSLGSLADIAPTILEIMNIKKPESMTGQSLLKDLLNPY